MNEPKCKKCEKEMTYCGRTFFRCPKCNQLYKLQIIESKLVEVEEKEELKV